MDEIGNCQTTGSSTSDLGLSWQAQASAGGSQTGAAAIVAADSMRARRLCPDANQRKEVKRQNLALYRSLAVLFRYRNSAKGVIYQ